MKINLIDNIPLDDGVMGYGVTSNGTSAYIVVATGEEVILMDVNVEAINALYKPPRYQAEREKEWLTDKP